MIGQDLTGVSFLDAFGGSGIMGMEAWSRNADPVLITEINARAVRQIRKQIEAFNASISLRSCDALKGMKGDWDIVFLDPPYRFDIHQYLEKALQIADWMVIAETSVTSPIDPSKLGDAIDKKNWKMWKQKHYGASMVTIFQRNTSA